MENNLVDVIINAAKEISDLSPQDLNYLDDNADDSYQKVVEGLIECVQATPENRRMIMVLATCTHVVMENMIMRNRLAAKQ